MADFPDEIMFEIFSRLPPKSIGKFRSLSKSWRQSLYSPQFIKSHLSRQKSHHQHQQNLILVPSTYHSLRVVETIHDDDSTVSRELDFSIGRHPVITCDGMILLPINWKNIFLVNPITREQVKIPNPPFDFECELPIEEYVGIVPAYGLGYDTVNDDYKVVLVSHYDEYSVLYDGEKSLDVDVYSVKTGVWKRIESPPDRFAWPSPCHGPSVNGAMHWLSVRNYQCGLIAALDFTNEVCFEIPAPSDVDLESSYLEVVGMCLCLIYFPINRTGTQMYNRTGKMDIWIMKEYGVADSWTKLFTVPWSSSDPVTVTPLCFIRDEEEEVVSLKGHHLVVHNLKEGTCRNLVVDGVLGKFVNGWTFVGSLVSPTALWGHNGEQASE